MTRLQCRRTWLSLVAAVLALALVAPSCAPRRVASAPDVGSAPAATSPTTANAANAAAGETVTITPSGTLQATLSNGLTVLLRENHVAPIVHLRVLVKAGSIYEGEYMGSGLSHLVEHLVHGGETPTRTEEQSRKLLEQMGNISNAFTSLDRTVYFIETSSDNFDTALDLLSDWMMNCTFPRGAFEREHGVVQRELERGMDDPGRVHGQLGRATAFYVSPIRHPVIGYHALVKKLTLDDVVKYYHRRYIPELMIFAAAGDFSRDEALAKVRRAFAQFEPGTIPDDVVPQEPIQLTPRYAERRMDVQLTRQSIIWHTVPLASPDLYPLDLLSTILSWGESSRLVRTIRNDKQLVHSVSSYSYTPAFGGGMFAISALLDDTNRAAAKAAILEEISKVRATPVTADELAKAKQQNAAAFLFNRQTVKSQANSMALGMSTAFDPDFDDHYVQNIQRVTAAQIQAVARKYLCEDNYTVAEVRPKGAAPGREVTSRASAGTVQKFVLDNGIRLLVRRNPAYPTVAMNAYFLAGVRAETEQNNGINNFMAHLLPRGTKGRTAEQVAETFDAMGGSIGAGGGNNTFYVSAAVLSKDFGKALDIFADVIMNPSFPGDEVERVRKLTLAAIRRSEDDPAAQAMQLLRRTLYTTSPYQLDVQGTQQSISRLTADELRLFHARYAQPQNMVMAVFGDVEPTSVKAAVQKAFAGFQPGADFGPPAPPQEPPLEQERAATKRMQRENARVIIAFPGMKLSDIDDRMSGTLLEAVMSGLSYPTGWIFDELRGRQLVYSAHGVNRPNLDPGYIVFMATCQPEKVGQVVAVTRRFIQKAKRGEITDAEFDRARQLALATHALSRQTNADLAADAAINELYGLSYDFSDRVPDALRRVTKADAVAFARKYFKHSVQIVVSPDVQGQ